MAKLRGPLMSQNASGTIGPRMTFSNRKSGAQVRIQNAQKDKKSLSQLSNRGLYNIAVARWNSYTQGEKNAYILVAKNLKMSGYNFFLKKALENPLVYLGLACYLPFNESKGDILYDYSKNNNNFLLKPSYPSNCATRIKSYNKNNGNALNFDGIDDYAVSNVMSFDLNSGDFTVSFWIKPIVHVNNLWGGILLGTIYSSGFLLTPTRFLTTDPVVRAYSFPPIYNQWQNIVVTHTKSIKTFKFYRNGVKLINDGVYTGNLPVSNKIISLACRNNSAIPPVVSLKMDNVIILNRVISISEISDLYNSFLKNT